MASSSDSCGVPKQEKWSAAGFDTFVRTSGPFESSRICPTSITRFVNGSRRSPTNAFTLKHASGPMIACARIACVRCRLSYPIIGTQPRRSFIKIFGCSSTETATVSHIASWVNASLLKPIPIPSPSSSVIRRSWTTPAVGAADKRWEPSALKGPGRTPPGRAALPYPAETDCPARGELRNLPARLGRNRPFAAAPDHRTAPVDP